MSPSTESRENRDLATEIKFLVPKPLAEQIRVWARQRLEPDPNGKDGRDLYEITSLYMDTADFDVFHRRGSYGRSKFRVRRYNSGPVAFLERKLKTRGLVSKRRSLVTLEELARLSAPQPDRSWLGAWYHERLLLRKLQPICQISYHRMARVGICPTGLIRLTVDENLRAWPLASLQFREDDQAFGLLTDQAIIELKYREPLPALFKELAETFSIKPQALSKYRLAARSLGLAPELTDQAPTAAVA
ncbi:MAG TPA: polyphosphate polymerase domain-containing protein [Methylomirabilota bacterium]|nr:polyphosphate polymerase domain-containing protein [Methylomirabilota bacterium]